VTLFLLALAIVALVVAGRALRRRFQLDDRAAARHHTLAGAHNLYESLTRSWTDYGRTHDRKNDQID
jgi:uncharacterized membrane protein